MRVHAQKIEEALQPDFLKSIHTGFFSKETNSLIKFATNLIKL